MTVYIGPSLFLWRRICFAVIIETTHHAYRESDYEDAHGKPLK